MARFLESLRQLLGLTSSALVSKTGPLSFPRSIDTNFAVFREGDRVIVQGRNPLLTKPLRPGKRTEVSRGVLEHNDIIGKRARDLIKAHKGKEHRLSFPTLEEYVSYTPRLVTPIYAADANLIVSLLDIHVTPPTAGDEAGHPPVEILEAGTGHGSLTLHLARAIQAANSNPPPLPKPSQVRHLQDRPARPLSGDEKNRVEEAEEAGQAEEDPTQKRWDEWRAHRRAVVHSVDVSAKFSAHAEQIVRGFRRGIYAGHVDFHVGPVEDWITEEILQRRGSKTRQGGGLLASLSGSGREESTPEPFLTHAILDMPSAHQRIPHVAPVLRRDGILAVFMPSVTQIGDCVQLIRQQQLPFVMQRVVELGTGISSGRLWDVRIAVKKSRADPSSWSSSTEDADSEAHSGSGSGDSDEATTAPPAEGETTTVKEDADNSVLVCRPKVGLRIVGGGFVGLWRRIEDRTD